ncbi:MAG: hypothetical protein Q9M26_01530 [Mariprofundales bacterium]|nr:hypothetical protein [Mariprofundales bacterium]
MPATDPHLRLELLLAMAAMAAAAVSPNLFVAAQAGYAKLSDLAVYFLIPSLIVMALILGFSFIYRLHTLRRQILAGIIGGLLATVAMEVVRETGYHLGGMPGDLPKLLGVLLLDRFALGPSWLSNLAGWGYHFWNGAAFGIIFSIIFGRIAWWAGLLYAIVIALVFMISPAVVAMGVGRFGVDFGPGFAATVLAAHIAYGLVLGWYAHKRSSAPNIWGRVQLAMRGQHSGS